MSGEKFKRYGPICAVALMALLASFSPGLQSLGWYVLHAHEVGFKGRTLTIPIGWCLESRDITQSEIVFRKRPAFLFGSEYFQTMTFASLPAAWEGSSKVYEEWKAFLMKTHTLEEFAEAQEQQVGPNPEQCFCASAALRKNPGLQQVDCILLRAGMRAQFNGTSRDAVTFLDVIRTIK
jgi:hypothetical protein